MRGHALLLVFGGFGTLLFPNGLFSEEFMDGSGGISFVGFGRKVERVC